MLPRRVPGVGSYWRLRSEPYTADETFVSEEKWRGAKCGPPRHISAFISENHHLAYDGPGLWSFWELIIGIHATLHHSAVI
jgi:hypothetical protein